MTGWSRHAIRYAIGSLLVVGGVLAVGWPLAGPEGRRGLLFASGVAVAVQWVTFGVLAKLHAFTPGYLAVWIGGTLVRFAVVGAAGFWIAGREDLDLLVALLALVGLFFILLLLEPWALRKPGNGTANR